MDISQYFMKDNMDHKWFRYLKHVTNVSRGTMGYHQAIAQKVWEVLG